MIVDQLRNQLTRAQDERDRHKIVEVFAGMLKADDEHYITLRPYVRSCPQRFFDRTAAGMFLRWLKQRDTSHHADLHAYLVDHGAEISRAYLFLRELNSLDWHDELLPSEDVELLRFIDRHVHPAYLRLVEGVLTPLLRLPAHFSRRDRGVGTEGLDLWSIVEELERGALAPMVSPYQHIMRNGIAHGGVAYGHGEITYSDKRGNADTLQLREVVRACDDLLDVCNAAAAALEVFLLADNQHRYPIPQEFLIQELREETRAPWWLIEAVIPSAIPNRSQLIIYGRADSRDVAKVQWSLIKTGILAERIAHGYDRYLVSIRSKKALPGWAAFDGNRLRALRNQGADLSEYTNIIEDNIIFFVPHVRIPRVLSKLDTLLHSFRIQWPIAMDERRKALGVPEIIPRNSQLHRNGWRCVLNGDVIIEQLHGMAEHDVVRTHRRRIIKAALRAARRQVSRWSATRYLPLGFAQLGVFNRDYRKRRLNGFGLGESLVCTVRLHRIRRIKSPDIIGSTVEQKGAWRIAWNRAWLRKTGNRVETPSGWRRIQG